MISDFGLSHRATSLIHAYDKAKTIGGAAYMSPERFGSNTRIDIYSDTAFNSYHMTTLYRRHFLYALM